ncbi:efflux transporter outer membrane subunit [Paracoccus aurantiacus]|uniref:Efflux transporter outer membrane subunit n=1 Tax=Paracoccus aurantiacus TaxID=2599412 RepID=A0A5C6RZ44_9RHOB|nr:efflux transporter outer membrane subunit [Paracoccus aurantiacus]TXB67423.1 efflux transporter outer membrane subunit [Paracoccus aurantiacus]
MRFQYAFVAALSVAGCDVPTVEPRPQQAVAAQFTSAVPRSGPALDMNWMTKFGDASLTQLLRLAAQSSPDLRTAAANVLSARAQAGQTAADLYPSVTGQASGTRSGGDDQATGNSHSGLVDASWEVDMFGKLSNSTRADRLRARAEEYDFAGAYVTLAAEVGDAYIEYRACRASEAVYRDAVASQKQTLSSTQELAGSGLSADSELALARANVSSAEISLADQAADCEVVAQSLATLVGAPQNQVRSILGTGSALPIVKGFRVTSVPSDMLRQRSDVAAAEANFAAELLDMKVAKADLYPSLTLDGSVTVTDPSSWSFGPALDLPIFDGGQRREAVRGANADAILAAETYRSTVLTAVEEVENALTRISAASSNVQTAGAMVGQYQEYFNTADEEWRVGWSTLLDREEARRQVQTAQLTQISQRETVLRQWIALYKAVGGGWSRPAPKTQPQTQTASASEG